MASARIYMGTSARAHLYQRVGSAHIVKGRAPYEVLIVDRATGCVRVSGMCAYVCVFVFICVCMLRKSVCACKHCTAWEILGSCFLVLVLTKPATAHMYVHVYVCICIQKSMYQLPSLVGWLQC